MTSAGGWARSALLLATAAASAWAQCRQIHQGCEAECNAAFPGGLQKNGGAVDNTGFVRCHGKLKLNGVQLSGANGEPVQLMGLSSHMFRYFGNCYTKASLGHLVETWGINVFRAAMYIGEGGYNDNPGHKDKVLEIVEWCKELGIYVIIDWHVMHPGNPNDGVYRQADAFWRDIARRLRNEDHVLYEIANEPNGVDWGTVLGYHNRIIDVIRSEDPETIILAGTPNYSSRIQDPVSRPVRRPHNVMYSFHFYTGSSNSHQYMYDAAQQIPVFVTEWGVTNANGGGGPYIQEAYRFLEGFNSVGAKGVKLSWAAWNFGDSDEGAAVLNPGSCETRRYDNLKCGGVFLRAYTRARAPRCDAGSVPRPPVVRPPAVSPRPVPPAPSPAPNTPAACPAVSFCGCSWTENGARCHAWTDDGSECFCRCCCRHTGRCGWRGHRGGGPAPGPAPVPTPRSGCDGVLNRQACNSRLGGCHTCGNRIAWFQGRGLSLRVARNRVAAQFPRECGACRG